MTTKELITELQKCDPESRVEISISQYNKNYPVAYCGVDQVCNKQNGQDTRIKIALPKNMRTLVKSSHPVS